MYQHHTLETMLAQANQAEVMRQARLNRLAHVAGTSHGQTWRLGVARKVEVVLALLLLVLGIIALS